MPKILSVCVPVYNGEEYLRGTLENIEREITRASLWRQVEINISDNSSEDRTYEIAQEFQQNHPKDVNLNRNERNVNFDGNLKAVLGMSNARYAHVLCADDYYLPGGLGKIVEVLAKGDFSLVLVANNNYDIIGRKYIERRQWQSPDELLSADVETRDASFFLEKGYVKMLTASSLVFDVGALNLEDCAGPWAHMRLALRIIEKNPHAYLFADTQPLVSVRVGNQRWLNKDSAPSIYLEQVRFLREMTLGRAACAEKFLRYTERKYLFPRTSWGAYLFEYMRVFWRQKRFWRYLLKEVRLRALGK